MTPPIWTKEDLLETIDVVVGEEEEIITVYKNIVAKNSTYLNAECKANSGDAIVLSPELTSSHAFLSFLEFCLKGFTTTGSDNLATADNYTELIRLYTLAVLLGSKSLANYCVEKVFANFEASDEPPKVEDVVLAWQLLADSEKSGMKNLLAYLWASEVDNSRTREVCKELPNEFLMMIIEAKDSGGVTEDKLHRYLDWDAEDEGYEAVDCEVDEEPLE